LLAGGNNNVDPQKSNIATLHCELKLDAGAMNWAVLGGDYEEEGALSRLEKIVPEELRNPTHGVKLGQPLEHVSLVRVDLDPVGDLILLQDAFQLMCPINSQMALGTRAVDNLPLWV
jgi:hypothetical protein